MHRYPRENEILLPPLSVLEVTGSRVDGTVVVVKMRPSVAHPCARSNPRDIARAKALREEQEAEVLRERAKSKAASRRAEQLGREKEWQAALHTCTTQQLRLKASKAEAEVAAAREAAAAAELERGVAWEDRERAAHELDGLRRALEQKEAAHAKEVAEAERARKAELAAAMLARKLIESKAKRGARVEAVLKALKERAAAAREQAAKDEAAKEAAAAAKEAEEKAAAESALTPQRRAKEAAKLAAARKAADDAELRELIAELDLENTVCTLRERASESVAALGCMERLVELGADRGARVEASQLGALGTVVAAMEAHRESAAHLLAGTNALTTCLDVPGVQRAAAEAGCLPLIVDSLLWRATAAEVQTRRALHLLTVGDEEGKERARQVLEERKVPKKRIEVLLAPPSEAAEGEKSQQGSKPSETRRQGSRK